MKTLLLSILVLLSLSCKERTQASSSNPEHFAQLYAKLLLANERYKSSDSTITLEIHGKNTQDILEAAGKSEGELSDYLKGIADSPEQLQEFFDLVNKEIEKHRTNAAVEK